MAAFGHDVFLFEEHALVQVGIKICLHESVWHVSRPVYEVVYGALRPVGVENLDAVALGHQIVAHLLECGGGLFGKQGGGLLIAVYAFSNEIIGAEIADFQNGVRHHIGDVDELLLGAAGRKDDGRKGEESKLLDTHKTVSNSCKLHISCQIEYCLFYKLN